jgi:uncharacterized protein with ATP-grasp and redox domains
MLERWISEILERIMPSHLKGLSEIKRLDNEQTLDTYRWNGIKKLINEMYKDTESETSLRTKIHKAVGEKKFSELSDLFLELKKDWEEMTTLYKEYRNNFIY